MLKFNPVDIVLTHSEVRPSKILTPKSICILAAINSILKALLKTIWNTAHYASWS
jgi:hypothetical protein